MTLCTLPSFTSFTQQPSRGAVCAPAKVTAYEVGRLVQVRGSTVGSIAANQPLWRLEAAGELPVPEAPFIGATAHVVYAGATARTELARISAAETPGTAVLIPICKSSDWWSLVQDARHAYLDASKTSGHIAIGRAHAARIYRRLYHCRYLPGSEWDFLTYFEFAEQDAGRFHELLAALRDPVQNPEWAYVEREAEIWMTRAPAL